MKWLWIVVIIAIVLVGAWVLTGGGKLRRLYSDESLKEILDALETLRTQADEGKEASLRGTVPFLVVYTISKESNEDGDMTFAHHLSFSTPLSNARATGTYFLALLLVGLNFPKGKIEVSRSKDNGFQMVIQLDEAQHTQLMGWRLKDYGERLEDAREMALELQREVLDHLEDGTAPVNPSGSA